MHRHSGSQRPRGSYAISTVLALLLVAPGLWALDIDGRTDAGYQLDYGDNTLVNRAYNYESLNVGIAKGWSFSMYGGVLGAFDGHVNTSDADGNPEASDNALRNLLDALNGNPGSWVGYYLYQAQVGYSTPMFGLSFGRSAGQGSSMPSYDGLSGWMAPTDWLRIEAFAGHPWDDANVDNYAYLPSELSAGEYEVGGRSRRPLLTAPCRAASAISN